MTLKRWTITRSGANMRVVGIDAETGAETKITGVEKIEPGPDHCIATQMGGARHTLTFDQ